MTTQSGAAMTVSAILDQLCDFRAPNVFNPWAERDLLDAMDAAPKSRRYRLDAHFDCQPRLLLIGEAPGYQGCRFSGIPFTSEALLCEGVIPRIDRCHRLTTRPLIFREPSATIVWGTLHRLMIAKEVVMWNAFPWHPHRPGKPLSNRRPTREELQAGEPILRAVIAHFRGARIIAVGHVANDALYDLRIRNVSAIRHPANGGATEFRRGIGALVGRRYV